jgi:hypothetical protein
MRQADTTEASGFPSDGNVMKFSGDWDDDAASFVFSVGSSGKTSPVAVTVTPIN